MKNGRVFIEGICGTTEYVFLDYLEDKAGQLRLHGSYYDDESWKKILDATMIHLFPNGNVSARMHMMFEHFYDSSGQQRIIKYDSNGTVVLNMLHSDYLYSEKGPKNDFRYTRT